MVFGGSILSVVDNGTTHLIDFSFCVHAFFDHNSGTFVFSNHDKFIFADELFEEAKLCFFNAKGLNLS
ncbi:MAG: hypothetical protein GY795_50685 [Desulfobacterales bacterium]|nr:hypothetical protein [Desulfobacterales bacterium]